MRLVTPFTFEDITQFSVDPHARLAASPQNTFKTQPGKFDAYKQSVKEFLFFAAELSEGQKAVVEFSMTKSKVLWSPFTILASIKNSVRMSFLNWI